MIDTKELREKITIKGLDVVADTDILAVLDRLEAAEKERDELRTELKEIRYGVAVAHDTIKALRAKITEMEKQEPVAKVRVHQTGGNAGLAWSVAPLNDFDSLPLMRDGDRLYALPGAQNATSVPEGFAIVNAAHFLAVLDREDWRTAKNRAELRAMLAAAPEAKP